MINVGDVFVCKFNYIYNKEVIVVYAGCGKDEPYHFVNFRDLKHEHYTYYWRKDKFLDEYVFSEKLTEEQIIKRIIE